MTPALAVVLLVVLQRLAELVIARRNTVRLLAEGGREHAPGHYPAIVILHTLWLAVLVWLALQDPPVNGPLLVVFLLLQAARLWVLRTMGRYWTTRIITVPDAPLITGGPFRFVKHPNYLVVFLEIIVLPLAFGSWIAAGVFGLANAAVLFWRIRAEEQALSPRRKAG